MKTLLSLAIMLAFLVPATAQDCVSTMPVPEFTSPDTGVSYSALVLGDRSGDNPGKYYVDNDPCQLHGCLVSVWIYEETNGWPGLQRADEVQDDTCGGAIGGDTPII